MTTARWPSPRFAVRVAVILLLLGLLQLAASLLFYQAIDRRTLKDDHARRVAELLVVSDRMHAIAPDRTASYMTTGHLTAGISEAPQVPHTSSDPVLTDIAASIVAWEPALAGRPLHLDTTAAGTGKHDLVGSLQLAGGAWLNFRSRDFGSMWPIALRATSLTLVTTLACLGIGLYLLHLSARPLRRLTDAAAEIGRGREVEIEESGPRDIEDLAHAMNLMQHRIARLIKDQACTFEAISHDMRTPLARQKVAADLLDDPELASIIHSSISEMDGLLDSLQVFLRAQHMSAEPEAVDLGLLLREIAAPFGNTVRIDVDKGIRTMTVVDPLVIAIRALIENAVQYGGQATIHVSSESVHDHIVVIEDNGPGIPAEAFEDILDPFFRLDSARQRNTGGFGLGIPTAHRLMIRFGGGLTFENRENGGLRVRLQVPHGEVTTAAG